MGIRVGGLASGLDTNALVSSLMQLERRPLTLIQRQKQEVLTQQTLFAQLGGKLEALRDAAAAIDNLSSTLASPSPNEELLAWKASSSDEAVLSARVTGTATAGSTDVRVVQLATSARRVSGSFASDTDPIAIEGDTLVIDHGGAAPISLTLAAGGASLRDLASLINTDVNNAGAVRADVVFDGTGYRLLVLGSESGATHDVTLTTSIAGPSAGVFLDASAGQAAADATLEVFGLSVTRSSNTVSDLIPGVTLDLRASSAGVVQVQVERDDEAVGDKLQALAAAYNDVMEFIDTQSRFDATREQAGPLSGDGVLRGVQMRIQRLAAVGVAIPGNPFTSLAGLGVSFDDKARLTLDRTKLAEALAENSQGVRQLLAGDGSTDGIALAFVHAVEPLVEAGTGILALRSDALHSRIEGLDRSIERLEQRLVRREELLVLQFTRLESAIAQLQAQGNALSGFTTGS